MEEKVKNLEAVKDISNVAGKYYSSSFLLSIYIHVHNKCCICRSASA